MSANLILERTDPFVQSIKVWKATQREVRTEAGEYLTKMKSKWPLTVGKYTLTLFLKEMQIQSLKK